MLIESKQYITTILLPSCVKNKSVKTASPLPLIVAPATDIVYGINGSIRSEH